MVRITQVGLNGEVLYWVVIWLPNNNEICCKYSGHNMVRLKLSQRTKLEFVYQHQLSSDTLQCRVYTIPVSLQWPSKEYVTVYGMSILMKTKSYESKSRWTSQSATREKSRNLCWWMSCWNDVDSQLWKRIRVMNRRFSVLSFLCLFSLLVYSLSLWSVFVWWETHYLRLLFHSYNILVYIPKKRLLRW